MTAFVNPRFNPSRGGHSPGDIRDAFTEALELYSSRNLVDTIPRVDLRGDDVTLDQLCGLLWNCTDNLSSIDRMVLQEITDDDSAGTYAQAARRVREDIRLRYPASAKAA